MLHAPRRFDAQRHVDCSSQGDNGTRRRVLIVHATPTFLATRALELSKKSANSRLPAGRKVGQAECTAGSPPLQTENPHSLAFLFGPPYPRRVPSNFGALFLCELLRAGL